MKQRAVDLMTKEELIHIVRKSGCRMMAGLAFHTLTKEQLVDHLRRSCCPVIKELCDKK